MSHVIGVSISGEVDWHIFCDAGNNDYDTACGLDSNDPAIGHDGLVDAPRGQKITCTACYSIWKNITSLRLRESNFHESAKP